MLFASDDGNIILIKSNHKYIYETEGFALLDCLGDFKIKVHSFFFPHESYDTKFELDTVNNYARYSSHETILINKKLLKISLR